MSDAHLRQCSPAAILVPATGWVGTLPSDMYWGTSSAIGCNALRCMICDTPVRNAPGVRPGRELEVKELVGLAPEKWVDLPSVRTRGAGATRLYACGCRIIDVDIVTSVKTDPSASDYEPTVWRCTGHPGLELPVELPGGACLRGLDDVEAAAAFLLGPGAEVDLPPEMRRELAFAAERVVRGLWTHVDVAAALARAIAAHAGDADPKVAARALWFFLEAPDFPGSERILELLEARPEAFAVADPFDREEGGLLALATRVLLRRLLWATDAVRAGEPNLLALAKRLVEQTPETLTTLVYALFSLDRPWLADHVEGLLAKAPDAASKVLYLYGERDRDALPAIARRIATVPAVHGRAGFSQMMTSLLPKGLADEIVATYG